MLTSTQVVPGASLVRHSGVPRPGSSAHSMSEIPSDGPTHHVPRTSTSDRISEIPSDGHPNRVHRPGSFRDPMSEISLDVPESLANPTLETSEVTPDLVRTPKSLTDSMSEMSSVKPPDRVPRAGSFSMSEIAEDFVTLERYCPYNYVV